jgi:hypothetical protein
MAQVHEDIARILTHVEYIREHAEKAEENHKALEKRVDALEHGDIKRTAWAAGAGAAISFIASHIGTIAKFLLGVGLVLLTTGCANTSGIGFAKWPQYSRPVEVLVGPDVLPTCAEKILDGVEFWRDHGATYLTARSVAELPPVPRAAPGTVAVSQPGWPLVEEGYAGVTHPQTERSHRDRLFGAWVEIGWCSPATVAHELGHAIGLNDDYDDTLNVMYFSTQSGQSMGLNDAQIEWVR